MFKAPVDRMSDQQLNNSFFNLLHLSKDIVLDDKNLMYEFFKFFVNKKPNNELVLFKYNLITLSIQKLRIFSEFDIKFLDKIKKILSNETKQLVIDAALAVKH